MATPSGGPETPPQRPQRGTEGVDRPGTETAVAVIGGGHRGRRIARLLAPVATVRQFDAGAITAAAPVDRAATETPADDATDGAVGETLSQGAISIVATADDARNLLVTQRLRTSFDADRIYVVLNDPRNRIAFELPGVSTLCLAELLADAFVTAEDDPRDPPADTPSAGT